MNGSRILIAEDQAVVAMEIEDRLMRLGYQVAGIASSAERAIALAREMKPDLLLFDIRLDGSPDGISAAETILRERRVPVVFLSAYADDATLARMQQVEPAAYLLKPFDERMLQITLDTALYKHRVTQERLQEERERRAVEARLASVLDHSPDAIISADAGGRITVFNRGAERTFGYAAAQARGMAIEALFPASDTDIFAALADRAQEEAEPVLRRELDGLRSDGSRFPAELSLSRAVVDGATLVTAIVRDVSERQRLQEKFLHAQKLEAVGRLAAGVAHDFNNLLSAIQCNAFLAGSCADQPEQLRDEVRAITDSVRRGSSLTRQLLGFARRTPGTPRPIELGETVASLENLFRVLAGADAELTMDIEVGAGVVEIDPSRLEQALMNLVVNARDAMHTGGELRFEVATHMSERPWRVRSGKLAAGRYVRLSVADSGTGMDAELLDQIFEPFFSTKAPGRGTGLGLSTVLDVATECDGGVDVESVKGEGSTFHLFLPESAAALPEIPTERLTPAPMELGGSILVIDDDDSLRPAIVRVLTKSGCEVESVSSPAEALELVSRGRSYDLVIIDLIMPGTSGPELAIQLRERIADLPILYISGHPESAELAQMAEAAMGPILQKPFNIHSLRFTVAELTR